jgi:hypothetical protein
MKTLKYYAAAAACFGVCMAGAASADTVSHFVAKGALSNASKISGGMWVDVDTGQITQADLEFSAPTHFSETSIVGQGTNVLGTGNSYDVDLRNSTSTEDFDFGLNNFNLVDYKGGTGFGNLYDLTTSTGGPGTTSLKFAPDSIKKFYASGSLTDGSPIGGYLSIDRTLGTVVRSDLKFGGPDYLTQTNVTAMIPNLYSPGELGFNIRNSTSTFDIDFSLAAGSLVNYNGGSVAFGNLYDLVHSQPGASISTMSFSTTVNPILARVVPEPGTWGLMLVGFGLAGAALRRRAATA